MGAQPQDSWLLDAQPTVGLWHGFASVSMRLFLSVVLPLTAIRKGGEEFPVELTVCPVMVAGKQLFCGFLRDLSEAGRGEAAADPQGASSKALSC
jgi:hypothetical protein